ncbi:MAG: hypothetical protein OEY80_08665 [Nitrospirota bacterium]|nr:hypothetical protein [Nitrospirota bacterium]MDH5575539.1 hypothetical protein [Nitrospirota bacterium]
MMPLDRSSEEEPSTSSRTPLISIGLAILAVLMVPVFLYSVGPEGPIKVGDVVFAKDRHRVPMIDSQFDGKRKHSSMCFLEPRVQLVVQKIGILSEGSMIAEPIAIETADPPSCPPKMPVLVHAHQVTLKADLWGGLRDMLLHFFSGRG